MRMKKKYSKTQSEHTAWHQLFRALVERIEEYDDPPKDTGYWYGERALTGFLAAAAWALPGGWSLEEFTGLRVNGKKQGSGRGDLWVGMGTKKKVEYTIEAKAVWPGGSVENAAKGAETKLSDASRQLRQLHKTDRAGKPVAICYIIPALNTKGKFASSVSVDEFFTTMPKLMSNEHTVAASFWYDQAPPRHSGHIYPGVVVVARILRWLRFFRQNPSVHK